MLPDLRLDDLIGRRVVDAEGVPVGRIAEVRTAWVGDRCDACMVTEIRIGPTPKGGHVAATDRTFGVTWSELDLSDPKRPRLTRTRASLRRGAA